MHIDNLFVRNWANLPDGHYHPGPLTLITGVSGSGKTTIIDAIQTVMTAARSGFFHFNPGQDESSQKSKKKQHRTLESYALGCDDGPYARVGTQDSIVGLNFTPGPAEDGEPFCAMFVMRASLMGPVGLRQPKLDHYEMHIINGKHVDLFEHLKHPKENRWVAVEKELAQHLKSTFGKDNIGKYRAESYSKKEAYLTRLYAKFQGKKGSINTDSMKQMVKSFVKFMAYRPFGDIDQFMRGSVLEAVNNKDTISEISSMMKRITTMRREAEHIDSAIVCVDKAMEFNTDFIYRWLKRRENEAVLWRLKQYQTQKLYLDQKQRQRDLEVAIKQADDELSTLSKKLKELDKARIELTARCKGHQSYLQKEDLLAQIEQAKNKITHTCVSLAIQSEVIDSNRTSVRNINFQIQNRSQSPWVQKLSASKNLFSTAGQLLEKASDLTQLIHVSKRPDLTDTLKEYQDIEAALSRLMEEVIAGDAGIEGELRTELSKKNLEIVRGENSIRELKQNIDDLRNNAKVSYSQDTVRAVTEIKKRFPEANPRILGDQIEIVDEDWQNAIEGFLKGSRENILVSGEYEADARRVVRKITKYTRVVQGSKAIRDSKNRDVHYQSIVNLMDFADEYAKAYMKASFGNVQQADSLEALKMISRGLTKQGDAVNSYTYFTAYALDKDLVCGKAARQRRLVALEKEYEAQKEVLRDLNEQAQEISALLTAFGNIKEPEVCKALKTITASDEAITQFEEGLAGLDLTELGDLEERLKQVEEQFDRHSQNSILISERRGGDMAILYGQNRDPNNPDDASIIRLVKRLSKEVESYEEKADEHLVRYVDWRQKVNRELDQESIMDQVIGLTHEVDKDQIDTLERSLASTTRIGQILNELRETVSDYNRIAVQQEYIENKFEPLIEVGDGVVDDEPYFRAALSNEHRLKGLHNLLKNNILVKQKDILQRAQERFDHTFTVSLAQEILSQIERSKRTLDSLNGELRNHKFDDETFKFDYTDNKEFSGYRRCFDELKLIPPGSAGQNTSIFENQELSEDTRSTLDELRELLLQDDDVKAHAELERIADYRNYFNYEIYKKPEGKEKIALSTYGTGSGGQLETPFYVVMAAAFQSTMGFHEVNCHLRTIIIDESFSNLDEKRSRRILQYLNGKLGLQILFALPSIKSGPFKSICTNQIVVQKIKDINPPPGSELNTRVIVDSQVLDHEAIEKMFDGYKKNVSKQASLEFLNLLETEEGLA